MIYLRNCLTANTASTKNNPPPPFSLGGEEGGFKYAMCNMYLTCTPCLHHRSEEEQHKRYMTTRTASSKTTVRLPCVRVAVLTSLSKTMPKWSLLTVASENCMKSAPPSVAGCLRPPTQPRSVTRKDLSFQSESVGPKHCNTKQNGTAHNVRQEAAVNDKE